MPSENSLYMSSTRVRTAAIGLGNRTCKYLSYLMKNQELAELVAVVDTDASRLRKFQRMYRLPALKCFDSLDALISSGTEVDACIIGTPDTVHYEQTVKALNAGWHVLLEKPMGQTEYQCRDIVRLSQEKGKLVAVCYVLRYHPYFLKLKELTERSDVGHVISVDHTENVGIDRAVHTFVRGPWNKTEMNTSVFFTKCCHDVDLVLWLAGTDVKRVVPVRGKYVFRPELAPEGADSRCLQCAMEHDCPYSAVDLYLRRKDWIGGFDTRPDESQDAMIARILRDSRYGRCAYRCPENGVEDCHVVLLEMESGVSARVTMNCITEKTDRETVIDCEKAVIHGNESVIELAYKDGSGKEVFDFRWTGSLGFHAEADFHIVKDFMEAIKEGRSNTRTSSDIAVFSHLVCLSAE